MPSTRRQYITIHPQWKPSTRSPHLIFNRGAAAPVASETLAVLGALTTHPNGDSENPTPEGPSQHHRSPVPTRAKAYSSGATGIVDKNGNTYSKSELRSKSNKGGGQHRDIDILNTKRYNNIDKRKEHHHAHMRDQSKGRSMCGCGDRTTQEEGAGSHHNIPDPTRTNKNTSLTHTT